MAQNNFFQPSQDDSDSPNSSNPAFTGIPKPPLSWWQKRGPDTRAVLIFFPILTLIVITNSWFMRLAFFISEPLQILLFIIQGILVVKLAQSDSRYTKKDYTILGFRAGLMNGAIYLFFLYPIVETLVGFVLMGPAEIPMTLSILPYLIAKNTLMVLGTVLLVGISAWLYGNYGLAKSSCALAGIGCGCSTMIIAATAFLLWQLVSNVVIPFVQSIIEMLK